MRYGKRDMIDFESPLTRLVWITSGLSIIVTYAVSYWLIRDLPANMWLVLSTIISCGTLGAALIPELTKVFTSPKYFPKEIEGFMFQQYRHFSFESELLERGLLQQTLFVRLNTAFHTFN